MHFAFPPPKRTAQTLPFRRPPKSSYRRRRQLQVVAMILCGLAALVFLGRALSSSQRSYSHSAQTLIVSDHVPAGTPRIVLVTVLDPDYMSVRYRQRVMENRKYYAEKHGYATFFPNVTDYSLGTSPRTWAIVPGLRHAMTTFPHSTFFFHLSPHALIMDTSQDLQSTLLDRTKLESVMLRDKPVVPPDSVIRTFAHLRGDRIDLILTQDNEGLCQGSFVLRQGEWAKFFLDTWFDPLYRSYNFQKAEGHALEHIIQWHPTILTKLALVPIKLLNAYNVNIKSRGGDEVMYKSGDFIVRMVGCELDGNRDCEDEFNKYWETWRSKIS